MNTHVHTCFGKLIMECLGAKSIRKDWILLIDLCVLNCMLLLSVMILGINGRIPQASLLLISGSFSLQLQVEDSNVEFLIFSSLCS